MTRSRVSHWHCHATLGLVLLIGGVAPAIARTPATPNGSVGSTSEIDHALLWGRSIDQISLVMTMKLGFQVTPGRNPDGVANRYVRFEDRSYLELLGIERADAKLDPGMQSDQSSLHGNAGARAFGLRSSILEEARNLLEAQGFAPTPVFTAPESDPDGDGPANPPRWRLFAFDHPPLSNQLFYIDYATLKTTPARTTDVRVSKFQPNGVRALTGIWLLSADAEADRKQLARMGFDHATPVRFPQFAAQGYRIAVAGKELLALEPAGAGLAAQALASGGPQVFGISVEVEDLERARRRVERGYDVQLASYQVPRGSAFLAPTQSDLGLLIEFRGPAAGTTDTSALDATASAAHR